MRLTTYCLMLCCITFLLLAERGPLAGQETKDQHSQGLSVFGVTVSSQSFNPSRGDAVKLNYRLSKSATVTVKVFDPDMELIRILAEKSQREMGPNSEVWDGKDMDGKVVPNDAYFFTIEAEDPLGGKSVYDPITFSGGEPFDVTQGDFNPEAGTLTYKLSQPSRVLVRVGISGGALLKTVVDWEPRIRGEVTEYWNGKDEDNLIDVLNHPNFTTVITYFTLPETSVITFGNPKYDYRTYKSNLGAVRSKKDSRPMANKRKLSPHFLTSRLRDRSFKPLLSFPELRGIATGEIPIAKDQVIVRVDVADQDRELLLKQQFEIILFVNTVFFAEEEKAYVPFNFPWELKLLPAGEHVLTVNVITFGGQIGVATRKVKVIK